MSVPSGKSGGSHLPPPPPDPVLVLSGKTSVTSLVFLSDDVIVTGHQNGLIQEWSLPIRRAVSSWPGHSDTVLWLATIAVPAEDDVCDTHKLLLSQGRDGLVKAWAKHSHDKEWILVDQIPSAPLIFCNSAIIESSSGTFISTPSEETSHVDIYKTIPSPGAMEQIAICFSFSKSTVCVLKPPNVKGYGMCMRMCAIASTSIRSQNCDSYLLVGYESGAVSLWNALQGEMLHSLRLHDDSVMGLSCWLNTVSEQVTGLSASVNNTVQCWTISDDQTINKNNSVSVTNEGFNDIAIRKDGRIFVTGGWDSRGRVFGFKKLRPLAVLTFHKESINCVEFGPNNEVVLASKDGYVTFWDVFINS